MVTSNRPLHKLHKNPRGLVDPWGLARAGLLAFVILLLWSMPRQAAGTSADTFTNSLPLVFKPVADLKSLVTKITVTLPQPLAWMSGNWCTWGGGVHCPRAFIMNP